MGIYETAEQRQRERENLELDLLRSQKEQRQQQQDKEELYRYLQLVFFNKDEASLPKIPLLFNDSLNIEIASYFYDLVDAEIKRRESEKG